MLNKNNGVCNFQLQILIFFSCISLLYFEVCYEVYQVCYDFNADINKKKCIECQDNNYSFINNTTNCVKDSQYNDYYIKKNDDNITVLYPCSELDNRCYECDPELEKIGIPGISGICLSCIPGYEYIEAIHACVEERYYLKIITNDFDNCVRRSENDTFHFQYCYKYKTMIDYYNLLSEDFICPDDAPIFNSYLNSCVEMDCPEEGFKNGKCIIYNQKYKDRKFFISWFNGINGKGVDYLSINSDKSGFLLMELSIISNFIPHHFACESNEYRKIYFFDDEGRGLFDSINNKYEKIITLNKKYFRYLSISTAIKVNNDTEYTFLLNFEYYQGYLELINLRTGE